MKRLILAALFVPGLAWAQQAQQPPSGAMSLLGRCTTEAAQMIDRITALEAQVAALQAQLKAVAPKPPEPDPAPK